MLVSVVVCLLQGYGVAEIGGVALGVWIQNGSWTNCLFVCCSWWSLVMAKLDKRSWWWYSMKRSVMEDIKRDSLLKLGA
jgi:hypothetical protein